MINFSHSSKLKPWEYICQADSKNKGREERREFQAVQLWNSLPPNLLLTGATCGWRVVLNQAQRQI